MAADPHHTTAIEQHAAYLLRRISMRYTEKTQASRCYP
ncbi:hypothetical protein ASZ90_009426 [hydrocarbon metagenome]|uniref:Uncharacterized protein n=1 Tax=hydrocarbon metagenome TaxID=938273 RepID=A0A0W8FIW7_9ZZZZ